MSPLPQQQQQQQQLVEMTAGGSDHVVVAVTASKEELHARPLTTAAVPAKKSNKCVRFSSVEVVEYLPTRNELSEWERQATWWSSKDYDEFKITAKLICRELRRQSDRFIIGLDNSYRKAARHVVATKSTKETLSAPQDMGLTLWCTHGHSRRGLERWGSRLHGQVRPEAAKKGIANVVRHCHDLSPEELAAFSQKQTRTPRLFAQMMGQADAAAVKPLTATTTSSSTTMQLKSIMSSSSTALKQQQRYSLRAMHYQALRMNAAAKRRSNLTAIASS